MGECRGPPLSPPGTLGRSRWDGPAPAPCIDHYAFGVSVGGSWVGDTHNRSLALLGDGVFVLDMACPMNVAVQEMDTVQVVIPRELLDDIVPPGALHGMLLQGGTAGLLHDHVLSLVRRLPQLTQADAPGVQRATLAMIAAAVRPSADNMAAAAPVLETMLLTRARKFIELHLGNPRLSADAICGELRVSRSRLYALFQRFGGVSTYIQDRRLARIHAILTAGHDTRQLSTIAQAYGFTNAAHFSRAFRNSFGVAPRDVRSASQTVVPDVSAQSEPGNDTLLLWLRNLSVET
jgi:AraC-like DNA-binding protein